MENHSLFSQLVGIVSTHIDFDSLEMPVHSDVVSSILALKQLATQAGFELKLASGFRSFERQCLIWNEKAEGRRAVLDRNGNPLDINMFTKVQWLYHILHWSALPGTSRHHWGTEIDVFDQKAISSSYQLQLTEAETKKGGVFYEFHNWLTEELNSSGEGFFRPYANDLGGVAVEPWHLSFRPKANIYQALLNKDDLYSFLEGREFALKEEVLENFSDIYSRFVINIS